MLGRRRVGGGGGLAPSVAVDGGGFFVIVPGDRSVLFDVLRCGHQRGELVAGAPLQYGAAGEGGESEVEEPAIISLGSHSLMPRGTNQEDGCSNSRNDTGD